MPSADTRFTSANAREMSAKANAVRWSRFRQRADPEPAPATIPPVPATDDYKERRLVRVRKQLDSIDEQIEAQASRRTPDGQTLNWLAQAQARLSEQERQLAGRPLPGTLKPSSREPRKAAPVEPEPASCGPDTPTGSVPAQITNPEMPQEQK